MESPIDDLSSHLSRLTTTPNELLRLDGDCPLFTYNLPSMSSCPMASDDYDYLLISHHQSLILFHLPNFEILFSLSVIPLIETPISDICFNSLSNCFLLSTSNKIYSLSSNKEIEIFHQFSNPIWSITQTSKYVFICYLFGFSIEQWEINSSRGILINTWFKRDLIESLDMGINCIRSINELIGMTIKENDFSWRIDLFDFCPMNRICRGRRIEQENGFHNWIGMLFPLDSFRWLFADGDQGLILIDQTNQQQTNLIKLACNISLIREKNTKNYSAIIVQTYEALHFYPINNSL